MEPETPKEAERRVEVKEDLTLSDREKLVLRDKCEWGLKRIEDVVQAALFDKLAPLLLKIWKEVDRQEAMIEKLKRDVRRERK